MDKEVKRLEADVVIVGGGPAGCILAKDLSKQGKKAILIEQGGNSTRFFGNPIGTYLGGHIERTAGGGFLKTMEGDGLIVGTGIGGGTKLYSAIVGNPNIDAFNKVGIDLSPYLDEAMRETWVNEIPDEFLGRENLKVMDAALELGYPWEKFSKHIDFNKCKPGCTKCMAGCSRGAKWTGKIAADDAVSNGATLLTHVKIRNVIVDNGVAFGVTGRGSDGQSYEIMGNIVVCCAGGIGSPPILNRSGLSEAGKYLSGDPVIMVCGFLEKGSGPDHELPMVVGFLDDENGVMTSTGGTEARLMWFITQFQKDGLRAFRNIARYRKAVGVWVKIHDDSVGRVFVDGGVSKTFTPGDLDKLEYGKVVLEDILIKAGCNPYSLHHGDRVISHPGGTAPVGKIVNAHLETQIKNLYCCDISVMPEALGRPPTLTLACLAKRLADRLNSII